MLLFLISLAYIAGASELKYNYFLNKYLGLVEGFNCLLTA